MNSFLVMLDKIYNNMDQNKNVDKFILPDPELIKNGNNIHWKNVKDFLKLVKRQPDHFLNYLGSQLSCKVNWISESKSHGLIIYKKIKSPQIIDIMKNYLVNYVICKSCKSSNTYLEKDKTIRTYNFICTNCENKYYI